MCIIVAKPKGIEMPSDEIIENCWRENNHGAGYMLCKNGQVKIRKGFMELDKFKKSLYSKGDLTNKTVILHFRISTGGGIRPETTHPYPVKKVREYLSQLKFYANMGVCHNGSINIKYNTKEENDTMRMVYKILANDFIKENLETFAIRELIENYIGNSKLVFLKPDESYIIYNEERGEWNEGIWYSNTDYKEKTHHLPWWYYGTPWKDFEKEENEENELFTEWELIILAELQKRKLKEEDYELYLTLVEMGFELDDITKEDLELAKDIIEGGI